jgi:glutathione S-transferase
LVFRPDDTRSSSGGGGMLSNLLGNSKIGNSDENRMSSSMKGFLDCLRQVDAQLLSTDGPWFYGGHDYPTMIDFVYVSHVERMLASCSYWKGLNLRDPKWNLIGLNRWLIAFEQREAYLAFKSDYYTHVKDIPPQYGPGCDGGFDTDRESFSRSILGQDGSWNLPLTHDDPLQPLYEGLPLPLYVLKSAELEPDANGSYQQCDPTIMAATCRRMAAWKLAGNGMKVAKFASRGGPKGATNARKSFQAQLADPYAEPDINLQPVVDAALRVVCAALMDTSSLVPESFIEQLTSVVPSHQSKDVASSLCYLRDRVGVPRDLPLASARYLRAYLNWAIDVIS